MPDSITQTTIESKIHLIRGIKVMLDNDLAEMYGVTTGNLNKAVKRNIDPKCQWLAGRRDVQN